MNTNFKTGNSQISYEEIKHKNVMPGEEGAMRLAGWDGLYVEWRGTGVTNQKDLQHTHTYRKHNTSPRGPGAITAGPGVWVIYCSTSGFFPRLRQVAVQCCYK